MTVLAEALSRSLIHFVWQGSLVGLLLSITLLPLRKHSARARYAVSCVALAVLAVLPIATTIFLYRQSAPPPASLPAATALAAPAATSATIGQTPNAAWLAALQTLQTLQVWALPVWSLGVVLFSVRLLWSYAHVRALGRSGRRAEDIEATVGRLAVRMGIERPIRVLISSMSDSPSVVGWLRPIILLPAATLIGLTPLQLEAVLAHELAHVRRLDYLVNILQMLAETLLFYHPAVWWTSKRIRIERELCCDDLAVGCCGDAVSYARALSTLERLRLSPSVAMSSTGGPLLYRIQRLVGGASHEYGPSRMPAVFAAGLGLLCLALNVNWVRGEAQNASRQEPARAENPVVRDAPGVTVDLAASSVIHRSPVGYPESARKQGVKGTVQIEVKLDSTGEVADAKVLSGPEELRKAALQSVLNWHFTGDAGRSTRLVNISFQPPAPGTELALVSVNADRQLIELGKIEDMKKLEQLDRLRQNDEFKRKEIEALDQQARALIDMAALKARMESEHQSTAEIDARLQELKQKLGAAQVQQDDEKVRAAATMAERRALEMQMKIIKTQMVEATEGRSELEKALRAAQSQLEATPFPQQSERNVIVGHGVKSINTPNLPVSVRNDLLSRLPIREGDTLSPEAIEQTRSAVRNFDQHLEVRFLSTREDQVEIRITAPTGR